MYINSIYVYNGLFYIIVYMNIYLKYSMVENTPLLWNTFESIPLQYTRKHFFHWAGVPLKAFHWNTNSNTIKAK